MFLKRKSFLGDLSLLFAPIRLTAAKYPPMLFHQAVLPGSLASKLELLAASAGDDNTHRYLTHRD
jgi:hypothetical protein